MAASNKKVNISLAKRGMDKDTHASQLKEEQYTHALNTNLEDESGNTLNLSNEKSNILSSKFKNNFVVHGFVNDINSDATYFLLLNKVTGVGELGLIKNNQEVNDIQDLLVNCTDCDKIHKLSDPLETIIQQPLQSYETLISDACKATPLTGFNFNKNYPIKSIVIKNEKCGKIMYITDNYNPPRFINLSNIEDYFTEKVPCDGDLPINCMDFDSLRIFKLFEFPQIKPIAIELGGRLKMGTYEFLIAYCDSVGNEISPYYSITQPVKIFDKNNISLEQKEIADRTNLAIRLEVSGLDNSYSYYKVAVIQTADIEGAVRYFTEGIHTINDTTVIYSTEQNKTATSIDSLLIDNIQVEKTEGLIASNSMLIQYGITQKKEINLQPVVNLLGQFLRWQTNVATEDLYENGVSNSKFLSYNRDEVAPFGIRFLEEGGFETPVYPFIGRLPTKEDLEEVVQIIEGVPQAKPGKTFNDVNSIVQNINSCNTINRTKKWQYYNTAKLDPNGFICTSNSTETVSVTKEITKVCTIENVGVVSAGSLSIDIDDEEYTGLADYLERKTQDCPNSLEGTNICTVIQTDYSVVQCDIDPFEGEDSSIISQTETIEIGLIENLSEETIEKVFPTEYLKIGEPRNCSIYKRETLTVEPYINPIQDSSVNLGLGLEVYLRDSNFRNENCANALEIQSVQQIFENTNTSYFNNYYANLTKSNLLDSKSAALTDSNFNVKLHKGALWFKGNTGKENGFIVEVSKKSAVTSPDSLPELNKARVSIFRSCSDTTALYSEIIDTSLGTIIKLEKDNLVATTLKITNSAGVVSSIPLKWFKSKKYFIVVDSPIVDLIVDSLPYFIVAPTSGCYTVTKRSLESSHLVVSWDSIGVDKKITYLANVVFNQPLVKKCSSVPYEKGIFGYHESTETYSDNPELFDSSKLIVPLNYIPVSIKEEFEKSFSKGKTLQNYLLNDNANSTCKPIRHFRFPDNKVAPFMMELSSNLNSGETLIYPLGITIDENVINSFLDIAVFNKLITQEQRNKLTKYEIFRGDGTLERSVIASGILFDMRKYKENNKTVHYSNYPFNTYSKDALNLDEDVSIDEYGANFGVSNRNYTFHSPETEYYRPTLPSEMTVQGYMFGSSTGHFDEVKDHPGYVILSKKARKLAGTLAALEVVIESAINIANSSEAYRVQFGLANSINPIGIGLNLAVGALSVAGAVVFKYGRFRYQWLKIFRDLGTPNNFAYYYFGEGNYNSISKLQDTGEYLRGVNIAKYLKAGRFTANNEINSERITINNIDREESVFISLGESLLTYPEEYRNYDKENSDSSLTFASQAGLSETGKSSEVTRKIASPYVSLKNYLPSQYGTVNSIKWLTTSHIGNLTVPSSECLSIFGGDTYISRHTLKRKMPIFLVTAMNQADLTPFNYFYYSNIGRNPKFYLSYEVDKDFENAGRVFPDIDSDFNLDNLTSSNNYYKPPSKFYLYYYGIPSFLTETRINTNYRYSGKEDRNSFYPFVGDLGAWTQEKNVSIREKNIYYYNPVYSRPVTKNRYRTLADNYNQKEFECIQDMPNGAIMSLPDTTEDSLYDPWLIYRPLDMFQFPSNYGKLKDIIDTESQSVLVRFDNTSVLYNKVDSKMDTGVSPTASFLGGNSLFIRRPTTFQNTNLGYGGTQNFSFLSNEFGHYYVDAKRGQVLQVPSNGQGMNEISAIIGNNSSGMRNWFKEHLPFKILKYIKNVDIDNPYHGIGITMGWDSRHRRIFITKKDYVPLNDCIQYKEGEGFFIDETACNSVAAINECPEGYTFDSTTNFCKLVYITEDLCDDGCTYDSINNKCICTEIVNAECICTADVIVTNKVISLIQGTQVNIPLTTTSLDPIYYSWIALSSGVTGATSGTGNNITQTLQGIGSVTYTITPYEVSSNCAGKSITVVALVTCTKPDVVPSVASSVISSSTTTNIVLNTNSPYLVTYEWEAMQIGVTGASSGVGNIISQQLTGQGTVLYTITAEEVLTGCKGDPIQISITVESASLPISYPIRWIGDPTTAICSQSTTGIIPCNSGLDVSFLLDYTGSMSNVITDLKTDITAIANKISEEAIGNYRLSLTIFDESNSVPNYAESVGYSSLPLNQKYGINTLFGNGLTKYITTVEKFSLANLTSFNNQLSVLNTPNFPLGGGVDTPEPAALGIQRIIDFGISGDFRPEVSKIIIVITDAETNESMFNEINGVISSCIEKGIRVMLLDTNSSPKPLMNSIANQTFGVIAFGGTSQIINALNEICP